MELKILVKSAYLRGVYMTFMLFTTRMALFCTMLSTVLLYGADNITASRVFVASAYFNILSLIMSQMFVRSFVEIAEALVAIKRLQRFLEYDEKTENLNDFTGNDVNGNANNVSNCDKLKNKTYEF